MARSAMLCNAVVCVCPSSYDIIYKHDGVDKIRVDSTWQHVHIQMFCTYVCLNYTKIPMDIAL